MAVGAGGVAFAQRPSAVLAPTGIDVEVTPIDRFSVQDPGPAPLRRADLPLRSRAAFEHGGFGGFSGLSRSATDAESSPSPTMPSG